MARNPESDQAVELMGSDGRSSYQYILPDFERPGAEFLRREFGRPYCLAWRRDYVKGKIIRYAGFATFSAVIATVGGRVLGVI